jgi:radical SAM protein with 4Fe4S-binding SPASM domain
MPKVEPYLRLPKLLYVETTNRCNLRCKGCILYRGNREPERDISLQELITITDQLPKLERTVLHGVGEPFLNKELPGMIRHLKKRDVFVLFNSNGILLDEKWQNALIDSGLDELRISLDAASPEGYKNMRNSSQFSRILQNLRAFVKLQNKRRAPAPKLSIWFLGTKENIEELPNAIQLAAQIGIREVYLQRLVFFQDDDGYGVARRQQTLQDSNDATLVLIQESQNLAERLGIRFNASGLCNPLESVQAESVTKMPWSRCYRPTTLMYITANGNVLPCCISPFATVDYSSIILGNVFETSLEKIWSGPKYNAFRKNRQTETPPICCRGCGVLWSL